MTAKVLVTGGIGSLGQKFITIILDQYNPEKVIVVYAAALKQVLAAEAVKL